jgi:uncharacterized repeat protein (TIGR03806 family)
MKSTLNLSFLLLVLSLAVGCGTDDSSGTGGTGGAGGGAGGTAGEGGVGGVGGVGGEGGSSACVGTGTPGNCHCTYPPKLSDWGVFENIRDQVPAEDVFPFEVISPLFTDYALKYRFVTLTDGGMIEYFNDTTRWLNPVGTVYVKTFAYPPNKATNPPQTKDQLIETRIIAHVPAEDDRFGCAGEDSCLWTLAYVYNEDQTDAICESGGKTLPVTFTDTDPATDEQVTIEKYHVPNQSECTECHNPQNEESKTRTLGPSTGMFNRPNDYQGNMVDNQIDALYDAGWLAPMPPPNLPDARTTYSHPIELAETTCQHLDLESTERAACYHEAARSFLDSNCAHCHAPDGIFEAQGVFWDYATLAPTPPPTDETFDTWGVCRTPTSAGNLTPKCKDIPFDLSPGEPDNSLILCRLESTATGEMMPKLGRSVVDEQAIEIIRRWIDDLPTLFPGIPLCGPQPTE